MATSILSKPQQRKSLSVKKTPIKGLKNVLGQPYDNYWPVVKNDQDTELEVLLTSLLLVLRRSQIKIPWPQLRKMNKEERSAAKKAAQPTCNVDCNKFAMNSIVFGINAITRSLEKNDICCILLDANVDPLLLVKHIVSMAEDKNVPILLVPFLKTVTLETIRFPSAAIALKTHVQASPENYFYSLFLKVFELSQKLKSLETSDCIIKKVFLSDDEFSDDQKNTKIKDTKKELGLDINKYLYRKSTKERNFVPLSPCIEKEKTKMEVDFIPLGSDSESSNNSYNKLSCKSEKVTKLKTQSCKSKINYKPLKVKRIKGNEFRIKATKLKKLKTNTNV